MRPLRLAAALILAFALTAQGLLAQTARAAQIGVAPATGLCLSDEEGQGHAPDRDCVVHCLLGSGTDGRNPTAAASHLLRSWRTVADQPSGSSSNPRTVSLLIRPHGPRRPSSDARAPIPIERDPMNRRLLLAAAAAILTPASLSMARAQTHGASGHGAAAPAASSAVFRIGALVIEAPWTRATPGGAKVAGGFMTIRNTGTTADRLVGGTFPGAPRVEVHEMAMADGMMRMRELRGGLDIPAGGSVQLRPGGYHMMFMDLTEPVRTGSALKGTLVFEKAGTIEISYDVTPVGAPGPAGHGAARH